LYMYEQYPSIRNTKPSNLDDFQPIHRILKASVKYFTGVHHIDWTIAFTSPILSETNF
jgi:hypothetical protein